MELPKSLSVIRYAVRFGLVGFILVADLLVSPGTARAQHPGDYWLFSTLDGGGMLTSQQPVMRETPVFESLCIGGFCLYSNTNPGFLNTSENLPGLFVLSPGTTVSLEVVAIDAAASVKFGNRILDAPGESAVLGTVPGLHVHPSWQVQLPEGSMGDFPVEFRFFTDSPAYADSTTFTVVLTNDVASTTSTSTTTTTMASTTTTMVSTTTTLVSGGVCGDGNVNDGEVCDNGADNGVVGNACNDECQFNDCGQPTGADDPVATDALFVLQAGVGSSFCHLCICDVTGDGQRNASDALAVLRRSVGIPIPFSCPVCVP